METRRAISRNIFETLKEMTWMHANQSLGTEPALTITILTNTRHAVEFLYIIVAHFVGKLAFLIPTESTNAFNNFSILAFHLNVDHALTNSSAPLLTI